MSNYLATFGQFLKNLVIFCLEHLVTLHVMKAKIALMTTKTFQEVSFTFVVDECVVSLFVLRPTAGFLPKKTKANTFTVRASCRYIIIKALFVTVEGYRAKP